ARAAGGGRRRPPASRGNRRDRRAGRTREDRLGNCAAYAGRRLAPRRGGGEKRPADPSCPRELGLPFEVAPLARAAANGAVLEDTLGDERGPALRAGLGHRAPPDHELAVRIRGAAEEGA